MVLPIGSPVMVSKRGGVGTVDIVMKVMCNYVCTTEANTVSILAKLHVS